MHSAHATLLWVTLIEGALTQGELKQSYEQLLEMRHECPSAWPAISVVFFTRMSASLLHSSSTGGAAAAAALTAAATAAAAGTAAGTSDSAAVTTAGAGSSVQLQPTGAANGGDTSSSAVAAAADSTSEATAMDTDHSSTAVQSQQQQQQQQQQLSSSSSSSNSLTASAAAVVKVQSLTAAAFHLFVACMDTYNRIQGKIRAPALPNGSNTAAANDTEAAAVATAGGLQAMAYGHAIAMAGEYHCHTTNSKQTSVYYIARGAVISYCLCNSVCSSIPFVSTALLLLFYTVYKRTRVTILS
jgi:hypothetical protein